MSRTRLALVGLGMAVTPHAKGLLDLAERVEVVHAFSPSAARRAAFGARFPFPLCDSLDTILADGSVDAVLVMTPANTHLDVVRACAGVGKHILLEKPVEVTTARAEETVAICRAAGVTLGMVLQHRFKPAAEEAARILAGGELGDPVACSTQIRLWRPQTYYDEPGRGTFARDGGGVLISQGIHTLDLMTSLAGPVAAVKGFSTTTAIHRMETEDLVCAAVRFVSGAHGTIDASTAAYPGFPERIELVGTRGTLVLAGSALDVFFQDGRRRSMAPDASAGGTGADPMAFPHDYHRAVMADFLTALETGGSPRVRGADLLRVHRLIDALVAAGETSGTVTIA